MQYQTLAIGVLLVLSACGVQSCYVPGVAPVEFVRGQKIDVKAVKMTNSRIQLPYRYYSLQLCLPKNGTLHYKSENLGEVLRGDRIVNTPYEVRMGENINCKLLCNTKDQPMNWNKEQSSLKAYATRTLCICKCSADAPFRLVDNLPLATRIVNITRVPYAVKRYWLTIG